MPTLTWTYTDLINGVGKPVDFEVFDEIQTNVEVINTLVTAIGDAGTDTFNGSTGRVITFVTPQLDDAYIPLAIPVENAGGNLGEISYSNITANGFTVHNEGSFTGAMRWKVLR